MNLQPLIAIVDDEPQMRRLLRLCIEDAGWRVHESDTGRTGLLDIANLRPEAVLLDLGLPDIDGQEVLKRLREWSQVPVVILSVREDHRDKVEALEAGADDYVTKPFHPAEVIARLRAVMRRLPDSREAPVFHRGELAVDLATRQVTRSGEEVKLTATEYALLRLLVKHAGKVVTQSQLLREVWGPQAEEQSQYLRVHFAHLRKKIDPSNEGVIRTEPRIGYRLTLDSYNIRG